MKEWYQQDNEEVLSNLSVTKSGLSDEEVKKRLEQYGENVLSEGKKISTLQVFLSQFADFLVIILIIAAIISMLSNNIESAIVILAVITLNAVLGTIQHNKAEKSLASLKKLSSPCAKVIRDNKKIEIPSNEVLPGDILTLEAGDMVVADGRILENYSLQVNESSLTGESTNVDKNDHAIYAEVPLADRTNMVYTSSLVTYGRATIAVTNTGMNTEIGKIAVLMNETKDKKTPLQISLDKFSKKLAVVIVVICLIVFALSIYRRMPLLDSLMFAVALAVAAIPEALSSIVTIVQAIGTQKMAKEHAIVKELKAVESLGCVSVICSDKTGTLTQNKMTVKKVYLNNSVITAKKLAWKQPLHRYLLLNAILNNDSSIMDGKGIGDPTEYCLLEMSRSLDLDEEQIRKNYPRFAEIPFDSDRKLMSSCYDIDGDNVMFTKGALDVLLDRCTQLQTSKGISTLTPSQKEEILRVNQDFSENGLRVLAFAYKKVTLLDSLDLNDECDYTFLGLISMMDPPRAESKLAVSEAKRAGIHPVMITGDHKITATAIAREIGIYNEGDYAVTGMELDTMSDDALVENIEKISVYARVSPENKIRIVNAWQTRGNIAAMTGDGVNDAPALKKADIGVAMGMTGTDVSKDASAMILTDDNFATIIKAVANGRNVYRNIKNAIQFLLSGNMAGILVVLYTSLMALPVPFAPVHLLFINLLTDSLPAIAIGMEPAPKDLLSQKPRDPNEGILTNDFMRTILLQGLLIGSVTLFAFYSGLRNGGSPLACTMAFSTLTAARLFHGFNCRSSHSIFQIGFKQNWYSLWAFISGTLLLNLVLFVPVLQKLFLVQPLTLSQYGLIYLLAIIPTVIIQGKKIICTMENNS
ncbi:probable cation-transporting ATPase [Lachnospiraceae bacterium KM106-2]|nr:probable cation-transporting ATPase [Lachnospiraceae bacterium KM106-2]